MNNNQTHNSNKKRLIILIDACVFIILAVFFILFINSSGQAKKSNIPEEAAKYTETITTFVLSDFDTEPDKHLVNLKIVEQLKLKHDIEVYYGMAAKTIADSVNANISEDEIKTNSMLSNLYTDLEKYPNNILKEIQSKGYDINIYIVDSFNDNNLALATRDKNNNFKIYISNTSSYSKAVHHEMYHILEYYMKLEYDIGTLYNTWRKYNPKEFSYSSDLKSLDSSYVYKEGTNVDDVYFVSIYSKSAEKEDRAEVFADMMLAKEKPKYYKENIFVYKKVLKISEVLNKSFTSVKGAKDIYWNRFLGT